MNSSILALVRLKWPGIKGSWMWQDRSGKANLELSRIESTVKIVVRTMERDLSLLGQL
jgi:hypothetical protein